MHLIVCMKKMSKKNRCFGFSLVIIFKPVTNTVLSAVVGSAANTAVVCGFKVNHDDVIGKRYWPFIMFTIAVRAVLCSQYCKGIHLALGLEFHWF